MWMAWFSRSEKGSATVWYALSPRETPSKGDGQSFRISNRGTGACKSPDVCCSHVVQFETI